MASIQPCVSRLRLSWVWHHDAAVFACLQININNCDVVDRVDSVAVHALPNVRGDVFSDVTRIGTDSH